MIQYTQAFRLTPAGGYWMPAFAGMTGRPSTPIRPHPLHHLLDMGDRRFRLDAMTEIEDQRALAVIRQHIVDRAIERVAAGDQRERIKIALHRGAALHAFADH